MSAAVLEIQCAKPDCHWSGSPADAPTHPCPTPALGPDTLDEAEAATLRDRLSAAGVSFHPETGLEGLRELWLMVGDAGPLDRLEPLDPPEEPSLEDEREGEAEIQAEEALEEGETYTDADGQTWTASTFTPAQPWQTAIAAAVAEQGSVKEYRWLVVVHHHDGRETLLGRGKRKQEATVIAEDAEHRGQLRGRIEVVKTADVLAAAAEIEKRRELVDEPDKTVETPAEPEPSLEPPAEPELEPLTDPVRPDADPDRDPLDAAADALTHAAADVIDRGQREQGKPTLFDASDYDREDLALPKIDGHPIDRIAIGFGGEIMLDRSNPDHVALWRRLKLGRTVELWVEAKGLGFTGKGATNKDGELDVIVAKRSVVVQRVRILAPEDLENAADEIVAQARDAAENEADRERVQEEETDGET